jgi:hypothetical protein
MRQSALFVLWISWLVMATLSLPLPAQGTREARATAAAKLWLQLVDHGDYRETWQQAAEMFRRAVTAEEWERSAAVAREPLGKVLSRKVDSAQYRTTLPGAPDGAYVVIQLRSSFANKKEAVETVTMVLEAGDAWRVTGYFIK